MSEKTYSEISDDAGEFSRLHVVELCQEMLELSQKTVLPENGRVRELQAILNPLKTGNTLGLAESYIKSAAFRIVANLNKEGS